MTLQKWEYLIVHLPFVPTDPKNVEYLNRHGELGWELVSAAAVTMAYRVGTKMEKVLEQVCYFRRPLPVESVPVPEEPAR